MLDIQIQSTIIARACSLAGIPCRVTSFRDLSSITRIERFRDFDDPKEKDLNCLAYMANGNNRDGLALQGVVHELKKRPEEHKILLVLSDGEPADNCDSDKIRTYGGMPFYIEEDSANAFGISAVDDTASTVRKIRKDGIVVMGIYVGTDDDSLEAEKKMYGNDFAYIRSMNTFVPVVAKALKTQIEKID